MRECWAPWACDLLDEVDLRPGDRVLDVDWRHGDASNLPFGDGSFDVVVCQADGLKIATEVNTGVARR